VHEPLLVCLGKTKCDSACTFLISYKLLVLLYEKEMNVIAGAISVQKKRISIRFFEMKIA
jgi:hypothetical protein